MHVLTNNPFEPLEDSGEDSGARSAMFIWELTLDHTAPEKWKDIFQAHCSNVQLTVDLHTYMYI